MNHLPRSLTLLGIAAMSVSAFAAEGEAEKVSVGGFAIEPMGHMSSPDGAVTVHPKALVGVSYNTNVYATQTNEQDDFFYSVTAGVDVGWQMAEHDKLTVSAEYMGEAYASQSGRNLQGGRGTFAYRHDAQLWDASAVASAARTNDPFINTGEQIKHDDFDAAFNGTRTGFSGSIGAGLSFSRRNYLEDSATFGKDDRDYNVYGANLRVGKEVGDQSELYVRGFIDKRDYDNNTLASGAPGFNDSTGYGGLLGVKAKIGTRSGLIAEAGATYRSYSDDFRKDKTYDDKTVIAPIGNLIYRWNFEEGSFLGAHAFSSLEESVTSNAAWLYGAALDGRYRLLEKAALFGSAGAYQLVASGHATGQTDDEVRTTEEITVGAEYILHRGIGLRLKNTYTNSKSKTQNDFTRDIVSLELGFVY